MRQGENRKVEFKECQDRINQNGKYLNRKRRVSSFIVQNITIFAP